MPFHDCAAPPAARRPLTVEIPEPALAAITRAVFERRYRAGGPTTPPIAPGYRRRRMSATPLEIGDRVLWLERARAGTIRFIHDDKCVVELETGLSRVVFCDALIRCHPPALPGWQQRTVEPR